MEPQGLKNDFGRDIVFHGAIDTQEILPNSSAEEVERQAREGFGKEEFFGNYGLSEYYTDYFEFAESLDILTIHMPVMEETLNFFDADRLSALKYSAYLINTGRGALIAENALYDALKAEQLRSAALDVFHS